MLLTQRVGVKYQEISRVVGRFDDLNVASVLNGGGAASAEAARAVNLQCKPMRSRQDQYNKQVALYVCMET